MKPTLLLTLGACLLLGNAALAQSTEIAGSPDQAATRPQAPLDKVYTYVEQMPLPQGGMVNLIPNLVAALQYPAQARKEKIEGMVFVSFIVDSEGLVRQPTTARGVHPLLDAEALRAVLAMPAWKPGTQNAPR
ncbi:energy transducer TonB [Hymenobacter elongatus]|uniref:TonB family protein n=1 Tax=Hymenobacter elongatus TaxID=877208 RepID=A0A4Z0PF63_9BACT|nr:energy transducer TonB [Hymenobacter elongatus]TGE13082.1 TonB family protein [Hymenobacter elongatus]